MAMNRRVVMLDPDGTGLEGWMYVIVRAATGVVYEQQYGGTACRQGRVEGYLVPVHDARALSALRSVFEHDLRGGGAMGNHMTEGHLAQVRHAVSQIRFWQREGQDDHPHPLVLNDGALDDLDEAWIPVVTPEGPGYLVWSNSD